MDKGWYRLIRVIYYFLFVVSEIFVGGFLYIVTIYKPNPDYVQAVFYILIGLASVWFIFVLLKMIVKYILLGSNQ